jgi:predicted dehydrogenase
MNDERSVNWGIIGPGKIAHKFSIGLASVPNAKLVAVASRSLDRAQQFALQYNAPYAYEGYEKILDNKEVDIVYIATPHSEHFNNTLMCLEAGMPVLCEKPFTINAKQLTRLVDTARSRKVFMMEAIWSLFLPTVQKVVEIRDSGRFGQIKGIIADFCFRLPYDPKHRGYNLDLGGGALLDIGIYPVFLALLLMGKPDEIKSMAVLCETGADESCSMLFKYNYQAIADLKCSFTADGPIEATFLFEKGRVRINRMWFTPSTMTIIDKQEKVEELTFNHGGNGYHLEAIESMRCLASGLTESTKLPLSFSMELMQILDEIRKQCGIVYPMYDG